MSVLYVCMVTGTETIYFLLLCHYPNCLHDGSFAMNSHPVLQGRSSRSSFFERYRSCGHAWWGARAVRYKATRCYTSYVMISFLDLELSEIFDLFGPICPCGLGLLGWCSYRRVLIGIGASHVCWRETPRCTQLLLHCFLFRPGCCAQSCQFLQRRRT